MKLGRNSSKGFLLSSIPRDDIQARLTAVYDEFDQHGVIATQSKYQMTNHERFAVTNLIVWVTPATRLRMQNYLHHCKNRASPYRETNVASTRWLVGGTTASRAGQGAFWTAAYAMTGEKQPYFIDRINLLHRTGSLQSCSLETWDQEASYMAWAMHGYFALRAMTVSDATTAEAVPWMNEAQLQTLLRLILEGDYKDDWIAADTLRDSSYGLESYPFWLQSSPHLVSGEPWPKNVSRKLTSKLGSRVRTLREGSAEGPCKP